MCRSDRLCVPKSEPNLWYFEFGNGIRDLYIPSWERSDFEGSLRDCYGKFEVRVSIVDYTWMVKQHLENLGKWMNMVPFQLQVRMWYSMAVWYHLLS